MPDAGLGKRIPDTGYRTTDDRCMIEDRGSMIEEIDAGSTISPECRPRPVF
jgi:hypothetical protein